MAIDPSLLIFVNPPSSASALLLSYDDMKYWSWLSARKKFKGGGGQKTIDYWFFKQQAIVSIVLSIVYSKFQGRKTPFRGGPCSRKPWSIMADIPRTRINEPNAKNW